MKHAVLALALALGVSTSTGCTGSNNHRATLPMLVVAGAAIAGAFVLAAQADATPEGCMPPGAGCINPAPPTGLPTDDL